MVDFRARLGRRFVNRTPSTGSTVSRSSIYVKGHKYLETHRSVINDKILWAILSPYTVIIERVVSDPT